MQQFNLEELKKQNKHSAKAMGFLFAAILGLLAYGFMQNSLPAFLLSGFFTFLLFAESKAYKTNCKNEQHAAKRHELMEQLTSGASTENDKAS